MMMELLVLLTAAATLVAYLCRLDMLVYAVPTLALRLLRHEGDGGRNGHKLAVVLLHVCLSAACIFAGQSAWEGEAGPLEVFAVGGAALWIVVSYRSWTKSVPRHFDSGPAPLDGPSA